MTKHERMMQRLDKLAARRARQACKQDLIDIYCALTGAQNWAAGDTDDLRRAIAAAIECVHESNLFQQDTEALRTELRALGNDWTAHHEWLCHPGERCKDGCNMQAIPERLAVYQESDETIAAQSDPSPMITIMLRCEAVALGTRIDAPFPPHQQWHKAANQGLITWQNGWRLTPAGESALDSWRKNDRR